ncbi:hypothetical protein QVO32_07225 [Bacteroides gallinaceum]|nr:hypothetical protein [Bacteroides gallinaceum]MDN0079204.1 hypothetical protein [Bacteroides gallinaceum]
MRPQTNRRTTDTAVTWRRKARFRFNLFQITERFLGAKANNIQY